jgi:peptide/nickel transport system substrate-binding protein
MGVLDLMRPITRFAAFALTAMLALGASGSSGAETGRHSYTIPHELRLATSEEIAGLNPHLETQLASGYLDQMAMAYLLKFDKHNKPRPELASVVPSEENGGISKDGLVITYHLVKNAKWSDGEPFTAEDVDFSFKTVLNPANNEVSRDGYDQITKIETPDTYTVVVHLKKPFAAFSTIFFGTAGANPCLLPKHILGKEPNINNVAYNQLPVGIGPFKFTEWKRGDHVTLVADPLYFGKKAKLQRVVMKIIPDRNTTATQLQTHEIDLWTPISGQYYGRLKNLPGVTIVKQPGEAYDHLDLNLSTPGLDEVDVRRALLYGLDRKTINDKIRLGLSIVQDPVISPINPAFPKHIPTTPYDPAKANALLDAAGWKRGSDGVREKNGKLLEFRFVSSTGTPDTDQQIELIRVDWQKIGVKIDVQRYISSQLFGAKSEGGILNNAKFDIANYAFSGDPLGDVTFLYECGMKPPNGQNYVGFCNKEVDRLLEDWKTHYTFAGRQHDIDRVMEILARETPVITLGIRSDIFGFNSDLKGFAPNAVSKFDDIADVDI